MTYDEIIQAIIDAPIITSSTTIRGESCVAYIKNEKIVGKKNVGEMSGADDRDTDKVDYDYYFIFQDMRNPRLRFSYKPTRTPSLNGMVKNWREYKDRIEVGTDGIGPHGWVQLDMNLEIKKPK